MNEIEEQNLIKNYIKYYKTDKKSKEADDLFWSYIELNDLVKEFPEIAWPIIIKILNVDNSIIIIQNLAAGPLEDLFVYYGEQFIDRAEEEAKKNPDFAKLLGGVWQNAINGDVWKRIQKVCDKSWDK